MGIKIGTNSINDIKLGTTQVDKVMLNGKNLFNIPNGDSSSTGGTYWTAYNNTIVGHGTRNTSTAYQRMLVGDLVSLATPLPAGVYTISIAEASTKNLELGFRDIDGNSVIASGATNNTLAVGKTSRQITLTGEAVSFRLTVTGLSNGENVDNVQFKDIMLEAGSTATAYEPYIGEVTLWQKSS